MRYGYNSEVHFSTQILSGDVSSAAGKKKCLGNQQHYENGAWVCHIHEDEGSNNHATPSQIARRRCNALSIRSLKTGE